MLRSKERSDDFDDDESSSDDDLEDSDREDPDREEDDFDPPTDFSKDPSLPAWAGMTVAASARNTPAITTPFSP